MNAHRLLLCLAILFPLTVVGQTTIPATTYAAGQSPVVVSGPSTITTGTNAVTVSSNATVTFQASTSITLGPGFHASAGSSFYAMIGSAADTDADGLPDAWEQAHGLNPNNASDAQNSTSFGLTYLSEYQLGTNPATTKQTDSGNSTALIIHQPN